jgi:DNA-binding XRE family transcriptional regulator
LFAFYKNTNKIVIILFKFYLIVKKIQSADILPYRAAQLVEQIGNRISLARRARLWTQADLAAKIGVSVNTLVSIEKGRATVAFGLIVKALWALDCLDGLEQIAKPEDDGAIQLAAARNMPLRVRKVRV